MSQPTDPQVVRLTNFHQLQLLLLVVLCLGVGALIVMSAMADHDRPYEEALHHIDQVILTHWLALSPSTQRQLTKAYEHVGLAVPGCRLPARTNGPRDVSYTSH
jgi:alpha-beta hydrolase superfamily lysophospholipase